MKLWRPLTHWFTIRVICFLWKTLKTIFYASGVEPIYVHELRPSRYILRVPSPLKVVFFENFYRFQWRFCWGSRYFDYTSILLFLPQKAKITWFPLFYVRINEKTILLLVAYTTTWTSDKCVCHEWLFF